MTASEGLHWIRQLRADGDSLAQATKRLVIRILSARQLDTLKRVSSWRAERIQYM